MTLDDELKGLLSARAASLHPEPDFGDLEARLRRSARRKRRRARAAIATTVVVVSSSTGGLLGSFVTPHHASVFQASESGNQGGPLPTAPSKVDGTLSGPHRDWAGNVAASISRTGAGGVHVTAVVSTPTPILVVSGSGAPVCTKAALVSAAASTGSAVSGGVGTVGMEPLDPGALEVLASGSAPDGAARLWWAAVAVGAGIARVAAEDPSGVTDAARPVNGIAVLGGTSTAPGYYSVVAETSSGHALGALGFRTGWGPKVRATTELTSSSVGSCTSGPTVSLDPTSPASSAPAAPRMAASSVVAAFDQAYSSGPRQSIAENLAVVAGGRRLVRRVAGSLAATATGTLRGGSGASAVAVDVSTVAFLSPHRAEVAYRVDGGAWRTGNAVLGAGGRWLVSVRTYCADVVSRVPERGPAVAAVLPACRAVLGPPG